MGCALKNGIVYQIYPKSFCDSNGDGIGDIEGIISKLDYIKELGADAIWVSPMYPSPGYDNGYDISDYESIDPSYGSMRDFERLIEEVHARSMRLIIDLVVNHSSDEHPWFLEAKSDRNSPKRDYYIWKEAKESGAAPNNWGALFGGSAWTFEEASKQYYLGLFSSKQPDLNWANPQLRQEVYAMMRRWLDMGVDGFRMDVISLIAKPADMEDGEIGQNGFHDPRTRAAANPKMNEYIKEMRSEVFEGREVITIGEASGTSLEGALILAAQDGSQLDMVFQFEHMDIDGGETFKWNDCAISISKLKNVMAKWQQGMHGKAHNALFWNNHDQPRMVSRLGNEGSLREASAKMLAACLHMLEGTVFIYQGEELGMTSMKFDSVEQLRDSESINAFEKYTSSGEISKSDMLRFISLKSRDCARSPMQWSSEYNAGFSSGMPWMDINQNYSEINAQEQLSRDDSVFSFYKELIKLRKKYDVIKNGEFELYMPGDENVFAYFRKNEDSILYVCCNFSRNEIDFSVPEEFRNKAAVLLKNYENSTYTESGKLAPFETVIMLSHNVSGGE